MILADYSILVTGAINNGTDSDMALWKYKQNGLLDVTFGDDDPNDAGALRLGYTSHDMSIFQNSETGKGFAEQNTGDIVVVGTSGLNMAMWGYLADGTINTAVFGDDDPVDTGTLRTGYTISTVGGLGGLARSVVLTNNGSIYIAGNVLWKYSKLGRIQTNFGTTNPALTNQKLGYIILSPVGEPSILIVAYVFAYEKAFFQCDNGKLTANIYATINICI